MPTWRRIGLILAIVLSGTVIGSAASLNLTSATLGANRLIDPALYDGQPHRLAEPFRQQRRQRDGQRPACRLWRRHAPGGGQQRNRQQQRISGDSGCRGIGDGHPGGNGARR